jgi:hypothetical protein
VSGKKPLKADFPWRRTEKGYLIIDPRSKKGVLLDTVSWMVWIQCDGKVDVEQIVDIFSVDGNRDIIKVAINNILEKLAKSDLISWV